MRRQFSRRCRAAEPEVVLAVAEDLVRHGALTRFVGYELVACHPSAPGLLTARRLLTLAGTLDSWGSVDCFSCYLSGPAWREGQISTDVIRGWARSPDRWWRRAALVSTVPLNNHTRGGAGDAKRTLAICDMLVKDRDDMVVKGMSWALRELAKRDPKAVRSYLTKRSDDLAPRVRREVDAKLRTGLKNPPRRRPD